MLNARIAWEWWGNADNLDDCLAKSAVASARALEQGNARVIVEVFVPELFDPLSGAMMSNEGDQQRYWGMTRAFCDGLVAATGLRLRAIYPDAGVAAMLSSQWSDAQFSLSSLNDRQPVQSDDELVVVACPDPQGVAEVRKIADALMREPSEESGASVAGLGRPLVLFNPRLASGDVGIGLSVRRLRSEFLASFCMAYALRPFEGGAVFKQHPDKWKVFYADPAQQGRFTLIAERAERPGGEELENIILDFLDEGIAGSQNGARGGQDGGSVGDSEPPGWASTLGEVGKVAASLQRFMRDITR